MKTEKMQWPCKNISDRTNTAHAPQNKCFGLFIESTLINLKGEESQIQKVF